MTGFKPWTVRPSPPRLAVAARTATFFGLAVEVSNLVGYTRVGLVSASGAFTLQYAPRLRVRRDRVVLPLTAASLAACLAVGCVVSSERWLGPLVVAAVTFVASCLCEGLSVPPPGIASLVLVSAIGTNLPSSDLASFTLGILTVGLVGAMFALVDPLRRPRLDASAAEPPPRATPAMSTKSLSVADRIKTWFTVHYLRSPVPLMATRASAAVLASGLLAVALRLPRPYWAMAAAAGIFALGSYAAVTFERAVLRLLGTLFGVALAAGLVGLHPVGVALALSLAVLVFLGEWFVLRNYALAMVFVTPLALVLTNAAGQGQLAGALLWSRTGETVIGCAFGLLLGLTVTSKWATRQLRFALAEASRAMLDLITSADPGTRRERAALEERLERLARIATRTAQERRRVRAAVAPLRPAVDASELLGRRILTAYDEGTLLDNREDLLVKLALIPKSALRS